MYTPAKHNIYDKTINFMVFFLAAIFFITLFASTAYAEQMEWKYVFNPPGAERTPWYYVTYGNGKFVTVGKGGDILCTSDGKTWIRGLSENKSDLLAVEYGNGIFVAAGKGAIIFSEDGLYWELSDYKKNSDVQALAFGNGKFVAVNNYGEIYYSSDARKWTKCKLAFDEELTTVAFCNGRFTVAGLSVTLMSDDGVNWKYYDMNPGAYVVSAVVRTKEGKYVGIGERGQKAESGERYKEYLSMCSTDGLNWNPEEFYLGLSWDTVLDPKNNYIIRGITAISPEGKIWVVTTDITVHSVKITSGNGIAIAVKTDGNAKTYPAVKDWSAPITSYSLKSVAYGNGKFLAVGRDNIFAISNDGQKWMPHTLVDGIKYNINDMAFGEGHFVAVGSSGIMASLDGIEWKTVNPQGIIPVLEGVTYGNEIFIAAGESAKNSRQRIVLTSTDGLDWTERDPGKGAVITAVAFGSGRFVAGCSNGAIITSPDGVNWSEDNFPSGAQTSAIIGIAFGNGSFMAISEDKKILLSADGVRWKTVSPSLQGFKPTEVAYGGGLFAVISGDRIFTSEDCLTWTDTGFKCEAGLEDIMYANNRFIAVHSRGSIISCHISEVPKESQPSASKKPGEVSVTINGSNLTFDQPPVLINGRTMVPLRGIFEALGAKVYWEESTQTVTATRGNTIITFRIGDSNAGVAGKAVKISPAAQVINGRTLVPVRFVSEALNAKVEWDEASSTVIISTSK